MSFSVLVVEDEPVLRLNLAWHLEEKSLDVRDAGNADDAIKVLELLPEIRLIFTDIDMPGSMDGLKLSGLRSRSVAPSADHHHLRKTDGGSDRPARPHDVFSKPYSLQAVVAAMRELVHDAGV